MTINNYFYNTNLQVLTDWKLIAIVLGIAGLTLFLLLFGEAVPYLQGVVVQLEDAEHNNGRNVRFC